MAFMNQERKAKIQPWVKRILNKYRVKGSLSVRNHSTLVLNITSGPIDFVENMIQTDRETIYAKKIDPREVQYMRERQSISVNPYWYHEHFSGKAKEFLTAIMVAMNEGNHNNSRAEIDYFDVGWYVDVNIGKWNKPYKLT